MHSLTQRIYDLEARAAKFASDVRVVVKTLSHNPYTIDDIRQVVRSSGSIGANYIEANETLGRKDFLMHLRISRKEAKESAYWLRILQGSAQGDFKDTLIRLFTEAKELERIFAAIIRNCMAKKPIAP